MPSADHAVVRKNASEEPTSPQLTEFFRQVTSGRVTMRRLQNFLRDPIVEMQYERMRSIFGVNFIAPEQLMKVNRAIKYNSRQFDSLRLNNLTKGYGYFQSIRALNAWVVPAPPVPMSISTMCDIFGLDGVKGSCIKDKELFTEPYQFKKWVTVYFDDTFDSTVVPLPVFIWLYGVLKHFANDLKLFVGLPYHSYVVSQSTCELGRFSFWLSQEEIILDFDPRLVQKKLIYCHFV
jgi:hypothetical protein